MQRRALGLLFTGIALVLLALAAAAVRHGVRGVIVAVAAIALAGWLVSVGLSALRPRR